MKICNCTLNVTNPEACKKCGNNITEELEFNNTVSYTPVIKDREYRCSKCTSFSVNLEYDKDCDQLNVTCERCGFEWTEDTEINILEKEREERMKDFMKKEE
jgi:DNA-directed RNA polymerase subunit RPC12/RpoP